MTQVDHKQVITSLTPEQRADLLGKSDRAGLLHLGGHLGAIGATTSLILVSDRWAPIFMVVQGILICFLFTLLHETVHRTPFRSRQLNDWVGRGCGFLVFLEPGWFRSFHLAHHRYTNDPTRDPELSEPRPATPWQYLRYLSGVPETIDRVRLLVRNAVRVNGDAFVSPDGRGGVQRAARRQLALYGVLTVGSIAAGSSVLLTVWLLPYVLGAPFLRAYLLAEHAGCPDNASMFINTRTIVTNPVVRFVAWNMPYHAEHHAFPAVPFHKLAAFHAYTKEHLRMTSPGYVHFNRRFFANTRKVHRD